LLRRVGANHIEESATSPSPAILQPSLLPACIAGTNTPTDHHPPLTDDPTVTFAGNTCSSLDVTANSCLVVPVADVALSPRPPADPPPGWWEGRIDFWLPLPKISRCCDKSGTMFPPGSLFHHDELNWPHSPTTPFSFPFEPDSSPPPADIRTELPDLPSMMDSVTRVVVVPHVCGLSGDSTTTVTVRPSTNSDSTLVDTGANICITGMLDLLVDVVVISPLPISVVVHGSGISLDGCCTHRGLLPLPLDDGSVYYQPCFYCKNIVETIISP
jgi:hypothetical protein